MRRVNARRIGGKGKKENGKEKIEDGNSGEDCR
jgi:hypothetical protein